MKNKRVRIKLPRYQKYNSYWSMVFFEASLTGYRGFNQFISRGLFYIFKLWISEFAIEKHKDWQGFHYNPYYYDGQNHILFFGFWVIAWAGDPSEDSFLFKTLSKYLPQKRFKC